MKRVLCVFLAAMFMLAAYPGLALAASFAYVTTPTSDGAVYVRAVAGAGQPILGVAKNGDALTILKKGNTWHKVRVMRTGLEGYMYGAYITFTDSSSGQESSSGNWGGSASYMPDSSSKDADEVVNRNGTISSSDGFANLRWGPSMNFDVITRAYNGEVVWALEKNGEWYRCCMQNGLIGYIHQNILKLGDTAIGAQGKRGVVRSSDGFANVRSGAGTDQSILYTLSAGQTADVYGASGAWFRLSQSSNWGGGGYAYVYRTLVRFLSSASITGDVNLRKGPGTSYGVIRVLPAGAKVTLLATNGNFCRVDTGYEIGFLSRRYINY